MTSELKIQEQFILNELNEHGDYLIDILTKGIVDAKLIDKEALIESLNFKVETVAGNPVLKVSFRSYGRVHDMKRKKSRIYENVNTNADIWGVKDKVKKTVNRTWYARNSYGSLNHLIGTLLWGLSEQKRQQLLSQIKESETPKPIEL